MGDLALVLGSTGLVGRELLSYMREGGAEWIGVSRSPAGSPCEVCIDLENDAASLGAVLSARRPETIFHLAGSASGPDVAAANVGITRNLFDAIQKIDGYSPEVLISGSAAEYGNAGPDPIREDAAEQPLTEYGRAKLAQTRLALAKRQEGLAVTVVRLFNVIGPRMADSLAPGRFLRKVREARERGARTLTTGDLSTVRDYLDVQDVARGLWALRGRARRAAVVNLCSGKPVRMRALLDEILRQAGVALDIVQDPGLVRGPLDIPVSVGDPTLYETLTGERLNFDLARAIGRLLSDR